MPPEPSFGGGYLVGECYFFFTSQGTNTVRRERIGPVSTSGSGRTCHDALLCVTWTVPEVRVLFKLSGEKLGLDTANHALDQAEQPRRGLGRFRSAAASAARVLPRRKLPRRSS